MALGEREPEDSVSLGTRLAKVIAVGVLAGGCSAWLAEFLFLDEYSQSILGHVVCMLLLIVTAGWIPIREQRRSRIDLLRIAISFFVGAVVAWAFGMRPEFYAVLGMLMTSSIQFASAWLSNATKSRIRLAFAKSGKAV